MEITVVRANTKPCDSRRKMIPVETTVEVPERALKGKAIENIVK